MKNVKYYILIIAVAAIAAGLTYLAIMFDFFHISAFNTATECPSVYSGENALEELNTRLLYTSLGNAVLLLLVFASFRLSLKPITQKNNLVSLIICVIAGTVLISAIYDGWALGRQTVEKCKYSTYFPIPNSEENAPLVIPHNLKLNLN